MVTLDVTWKNRSEKEKKVQIQLVKGQRQKRTSL